MSLLQNIVFFICDETWIDLFTYVTLLFQVSKMGEYAVVFRVWGGYDQ